MKARTRKAETVKLEMLGHRVDPEVRKMLDEVANFWHMPRRMALENAIRDLHRAVFRGAK